MTKIYIQDARKAGFCNHGLRDFFKEHDLDWYDFIQNGMEAEKALSFNNANVELAYKYALEREAENGRKQQ